MVVFLGQLTSSSAEKIGTFELEPVLTTEANFSGPFTATKQGYAGAVGLLVLRTPFVGKPPSTLSGRPFPYARLVRFFPSENQRRWGSFEE